MLNLEKNTSYINTNNLLAKSLILKQNLAKNNSLLLLVQNEKYISNYKKIFDMLFVGYKEISNTSNLVDLILNKTGFFIASNEIIEKNLENIEQIKYKSLHLEKNKSLEIDETIKKLISMNYTFSDYGAKASYKKLGDILSITSPDEKTKIDISLWGDTIEEINISFKINEFKVERQSVDNFYIGENKDIENIEKYENNILDFIDSETFVIADELDFSIYYEQINKKIQNLSSFDFSANKKLKVVDLDIKTPKASDSLELINILKKGKTTIYTKNKTNITNFINYNDLRNIDVKDTSLAILKSFCYKNTNYICDDILSAVFTKKRVKKSISADIDLLMKINEGDFIVHIEHGVGLFKQIVKKNLGGIEKEYIEIEYAKNDLLFVPLTEVSRVSKYVGIDNPKLTPLGGNEWEKKLAKAKGDADLIARDLLEMYASRKSNSGFAFLADTKKEDIFRQSFPYNYTIDQNDAIDDTLADMSKPIPMDRLIVGDVGFGKTEIAFNAIYRAFLNKKQSILISPLVVLAYEHYEKALERFEKFGIKIGILTRLEKQKDVEITIHKLKTGEIDLVVGTHKLLSDSIVYKDLGLMVVDEEHKFGVADKEKIKIYKSSIDVLSMSATPIPRSLNMALSSLREMSILKTPPFGRQNIQTLVSRFDESLIKEAGNREFERGGQMFFVHNRVSTIDGFKKLLENIFPGKTVIITHGQLPGDQLEKRIMDFKHKKYDILLSTTVIENGIDFSNVNTIIINEAQMFGLSQIHQLRGRVGRSDKTGFCYLLYKQESLKDDSIKRLQTIVTYSYLGAGFELAIKDLEMRGAGDLLGSKQSGQMNDIGVSLFIKMVEDRIFELKNGQINDIKQENDILIETKKINTNIDLNVSLSIPEEYFESELDKINFYREIELISDLEELETIKEDFKFKSGEQNFPLEAQNLFDLLKLKIFASKYKIETIKKVGINYRIDFISDNKAEDLKAFLELDKKIFFTVQTLSRIVSSVKNFENEQKFIQSLLLMFENKNLNPKFKIKQKAK